MKRLSAIVMILVLAAGALWADYPPEGWNADLKDAIAQAQEEDKMLLLDFTGSDWCTWCHKLEDEVWNTVEFEEWAEENAVLVFLDFPRTIQLDESTQFQNYLMQQMLGVRGYPTVWLLGPNLEPLLQTGYRAGGAVEYIRHLEEDRFELTADQISTFQDAVIDGIEEYLGPLER